MLRVVSACRSGGSICGAVSGEAHRALGTTRHIRRCGVLLAVCETVVVAQGPTGIFYKINQLKRVINRFIFCKCLDEGCVCVVKQCDDSTFPVDSRIRCPWILRDTKLRFVMVLNGIHLCGTQGYGGHMPARYGLLTLCKFNPLAVPAGLRRHIRRERVGG